MSPKTASIVNDNGPIVVPAESLKLLRQPDSEVHIIPNGNHFLSSDDFTELSPVSAAADVTTLKEKSRYFSDRHLLFP